MVFTLLRKRSRVLSPAFAVAAVRQSSLKAQAAHQVGSSADVQQASGWMVWSSKWTQDGMKPAG